MFNDFFDTPVGLVEIYADHDYILSLRFTEKSLTVPKRSSLIDHCKTQLTEYFCGARTMFHLPLKLTGRPFQVSVWNELKSIPFGQTISYQDIALSIGHPNAQRAVGTANGNNRLAILVPCHRVINKNGGMGGYAYGLDKKEWLLGHEKSLTR